MKGGLVSMVEGAINAKGIADAQHVSFGAGGSFHELEETAHSMALVACSVYILFSIPTTSWRLSQERETTQNINLMA